MTIEDEIRFHIEHETCLGYGKNLNPNYLYSVQNVTDRVGEIADAIESIDIVEHLLLTDAPFTEDFGRRISQTIVSNPGIKTIRVGIGGDTHGKLQWILSPGTLQDMSSLERVDLPRVDLSEQAARSLFSLLLTSPTLQYFGMSFACVDANNRATNALVDYLSAATSLIRLFVGCDKMSEASFATLCHGISQSSLRVVDLCCTCNLPKSANFENMAECLARAIVSAPVEECYIAVDSELFDSLLRTTSFKELDIVLPKRGPGESFQVNRKWKYLLHDRVPTGLWPQILEKTRALGWWSHSSEDMMFYLLRGKPELVRS